MNIDALQKRKNLLQKRIDECGEERNGPQKRRKMAALLKRMEFLESAIELQTNLVRFTLQSSEVVWPSKAIFRQRLLLIWYHELQRLFCIYDRPSDCSQCNEHCEQNDALAMISEELNLYGCLLHGGVHDCSQQYVQIGKNLVPQPPSCSCTRVSGAKEIVCVFSGVVVGKRFTSCSMGAKDFGKDGSGGVAVGKSIGFKYRLMMREDSDMRDAYENRDERIARLKRKRSEEQNRPPPKPFLPKQATSTIGVAIKRLQLSETQIAQLRSSYRAQVRRKEIEEDAKRRALAAAETVMTDVLFDKSIREMLNYQSMMHVEDSMKANLLNYHSECKRTGKLPIFTRCLSVYLSPVSDVQLLTLVAYDRNQLTRFASRVLCLWQLCNQSPARSLDTAPSCTLKQLALAILYCMRGGITIELGKEPGDKIVVVPCDETLYLDLPPESMLGYFGPAQREELRRELVRNGCTSTNATFCAASSMDETHKSSDVAFGTVAKRKRKQRNYFSSFNTKRIDVEGLPPLTERDLTPPYLLDEAIGSNNQYQSSDITNGTTFLKVCLASFDLSHRQLLAELINLS